MSPSDDCGPFFWQCPADDPLGPAALAQPLIADHHQHLVDARIGYLYRRKAKTGGGKVTLATASLVPERWQVFAPFDFCIEVAWLQWQQLDVAQRQALVDHELYHCDLEVDDDGQGTWTLRKHDVEEFSEVITRHGLWKSDVRDFVETARQAQAVVEPLQPLPPEDGQPWWWQQVPENPEQEVA